MSKILAIADIHIHDYPQRNPSEKFRLYQSREVSKNIIEAAKREGAEILVIAGDILEKSVVRPYVQAEVKYFLDTLMKYFKVGYIIWGNHDQDNKGSDQDFIDSCVSVMLPNNLYYADGRELTIENTKMAFSNWRPEFDLSWIKNKVDVLFTHATISYSSSDLFKSQVLDDNKFDLAICGDIHKPGQLGKFVSIGTPQKCKMSDTDDATGVIFDCETKNWKWVNLNPTDNLMKFQYTPIREAEGWEESTGIWKVYKPDNLRLDSGVNNIKVPAWEEIGNLITDIILQNNLGGVHGEVIKNIKNLESKEVDFNFTLVRFYCKNWRSIDEVELYFNEGDKVLITGRNGSGKSSLLSALRYAFEENRFLKDFIQFGSKSCLTEVDFQYQNSLYRIQRGTKKYGLWIDGEPQKYNNKKEFEEDVRLRFPFIDYMDIYFFDSDHHKLIGGISPERKSEVISKFFKMDKIDAYNEEAENLLSQFTKKTNFWKEDIDKHKKLLEYIDQKLSLIDLPDVPKDKLIKHRMEGLEIQRKSKIWADYQISSANLNAEINNTNNSLNTLISEISKLRAQEQIDLEINNHRQQLNEINEKLASLSGVSAIYNSKVVEYNRIDAERNKLYNIWNSLGVDKTCSSCGQLIQNKEQLAKQKIELEESMNNLGQNLEQLKSEILKIREEKEKEETIRKEYMENQHKINSNIANLMSEINQGLEKFRKKQEKELQLKQLQDKLVHLGVPEKVILPEHFLETMNNINYGINIWESYEALIVDKTESQENINKATLELNNLTNAMGELQKYIKITGPTGKIYEEIMTKLAEQFSDNQVKYEVMTYNFRKKDHLDLASYFHNRGNWVGYQACSSGQQTVLDVNFLSKIVTRMGLLVMDEFLKHLDPFYHDICIESIKTMNIGCIMISSHMESVAHFNNKSCDLELNDSGITKVELK